VENAKEKVTPLVDQINERFADFASTRTESRELKTTEEDEVSGRA